MSVTENNAAGGATMVKNPHINRQAAMSNAIADYMQQGGMQNGQPPANSYMPQGQQAPVEPSAPYVPPQPPQPQQQAPIAYQPPPAAPTQQAPVDAPGSIPPQFDPATDPRFQRALAIDDWASNLSPRQWVLLDDLMDGKIDLKQFEQQTGTTPPAAPPEFNPDEFVDPQLASRVHAIEQKMDEKFNGLQESVDRALANDFRTQEQQTADTSLQACRAFAAKYNLDEAAINKLAGMTANAGIIPSFVAKANGNLQHAFDQALEWTYFGTPEFRDHYISSQVAAQTDTRVENDQRDALRRTNMKNNANTLAAIQSRDMPRGTEAFNPLAATEEERLAYASEMIARGRIRR